MATGGLGVRSGIAIGTVCLSLFVEAGVALAADSATDMGESLYSDNCAICHGDGLRNPGASFDLRQLKKDERARFDQSVMGGKGQMPPWKGVLSTADMDALWAFIRTNADN
jgi:mono/diheme cytochrome c family protein